MDLILGPYADQELAGLSAVALDLYDALLAENDNDLYLWVTGADVAPDRFVGLLSRIIGFDRTKSRQL